MSKAFKLHRARQLLLRAMALVTSEDEEGSSGCSGDNAATTMTDSCPTESRRDTNDVSRNGPPMENPRGNRVRRDNHDESQSSPRLSHHSRLDTSQQRSRDRSCESEKHSLPPGHALQAARNREGQRLFGYNPSVLNSGRKRRKVEAGGAFLKRKRPTWSRDCICLNLHYQDWLPSVQEKISLSSSGLGLKRVTFDQDGDGQHIMKMLTDAFPKLPLNGEFNLLRPGSGQSCKKLLVIGPPSGMNVPYLKDIVGQAKLYIRPNKDIEADVYEPDDHEGVSEEDLYLLEKFSDHSGESSPVSPKYSPLLQPLMIHKGVIHKDINMECKEDQKRKFHDSGMRHHKVFADLFNEAEDDTDLQEAITASLEMNNCVDLSNASGSFEDFLRSLRDYQYNLFSDNEEHPVTIRRSLLWEDTLTLFQNNFPNVSPIVVTFKGEPAMDAGGPRREYFTLLLKHISMDTSFFEGSPERLLPTHNPTALINKEYYCIGKILSASVLQGGPAPQFFAESVAEYWLAGLDGVNVHVEDISGEAQLHVKKVVDARDDVTLQEVLNSDDLAFRFECGVSKPANLYKLNDKSTIVKLMTLRLVVLTRKAELDQIAEGLKENNFLEFLQKNPLNAKKLFVYKPQHLTAAGFEDLFVIHYSTPPIKQEETTIEFWSEYLEEVESGQVKSEDGVFKMSLEDILQFVTGTTHVPPMGFDHNPEIHFSFETLPTASTCLLKLVLPVSNCRIDFNKKFTFAVFNAIGFGNT